MQVIEHEHQDASGNLCDSPLNYEPGRPVEAEEDWGKVLDGTQGFAAAGDEAWICRKCHAIFKRDEEGHLYLATKPIC